MVTTTEATGLRNRALAAWNQSGPARYRAQQEQTERDRGYAWGRLTTTFDDITGIYAQPDGEDEKGPYIEREGLRFYWYSYKKLVAYRPCRVCGGHEAFDAVRRLSDLGVIFAHPWTCAACGGAA